MMNDQGIKRQVRLIYQGLEKVLDVGEPMISHCSGAEQRIPLVEENVSEGPGRWQFPVFAQSAERGLASVPTETLRSCLRPVLEGLKGVDAEELLNLERSHDGEGPTIGGGISVRPIHDLITPASPEGTVRYIHLSEVDGQYSMGVFVFPPNSVIPLHDHPGMCVLTRVLYGDVQRKSFDLARSYDNEDCGNERIAAKSWLPWSKSSAASKRSRPEAGRPNNAKLAYRNRIDRLEAPGVTMLYPYEGNLHEFVAGPRGAAVLDVLLPPYAHEHHRDCTFYEVKECSGQTKVDSSSEPVWIIPTDQPEEFHCVSGSYEQLESEG